MEHVREVDVNKDGSISREEYAAALGVVFLGFVLLKAALVSYGFVYCTLEVWRKFDRARQLHEMSPFQIRKRSVSLDEGMLEYLQTHYDKNNSESRDAYPRTPSAVSIDRIRTGRSDTSQISAASSRRNTMSVRESEAEASDEYIRFGMCPESSADRLRELSSGMSRWSFDMFEVEAVTPRPLAFIGYVCLEVYMYTWVDETDKDKLMAFLGDVEGSYRGVPYHNALHGASVARGVYSFCAGCGLGFSRESMEFILILAGLVHDVHHPGLTATFLSKAACVSPWTLPLEAPLEPADMELALKYNDQSPLEHMHCAIAFELLRMEKNAFLPPDVLATIRQPLIKCILGTDMAKRAEMMTRMSCLVDSLRHDDSVAGLTWHWPAKPPPGSSEDQRQAWQETLTEEFMMEVFLHAADIGNACLPFEQWVEWNRRVQAEFHAQGDREKAVFGMIFSPLAGFDRSAGARQEHVFTKGFMQYCALPFFEQLQALTEVPGHIASSVHIDECLSTLRTNLEAWDERKLPEAAGDAGDG